MPSAEDFNQLGIGFSQRGDLMGARIHWLAALEVDPGFLPARGNLASAAGDDLDKRAKEVAVAAFRRILALAPNDWRSWNNLGTILLQLERYDEARKAMDEALRLAPDSITALHNDALLNHRLRKFKAAIKSFDQMEALGHKSHQLTNDRAHVLLAMGDDLQEALTAFESRWEKLGHSEVWDHHIPEWQGEDLGGKTILLHGEQGFGDDLMCSRFLRDLQLRAKYVALALPTGLLRLLRMQTKCEVFDLGELPEDLASRFDYHTPMVSAIRHLRIRYPREISPEPYLQAPDLPAPEVDSRMFNVGICWSSGRRGTSADWRRRITPLSEWLCFAEIPEVQLWSLQKDAAGKEIHETGADALIRDQMASCKDWGDTAAFVSRLDLVVSVDTGLVHLSGALGIPTIMISQFAACWRWWNIAKFSGEPWYKNFIIFRQPNPQDWKTPILQAKYHIANLVRDRRAELAA